MKRILVISDNEQLLNRFRSEVLSGREFLDETIDYRFSFRNKDFKKAFNTSGWIKPVNVKKEMDNLINTYQLIFSIHCKQLFPKKLVEEVRCVNIHPGLNPYNRGWFPQVFSIINGLPSGATIHEIDAKLDHGPIIAQKEVKVESWDTSLTVYEKVLDAEIGLLTKHFNSIIEGDYTTISPKEGNLNLKADFDSLCELDLDKRDTIKNHINKLRALTHGEYSNAYFIDDEGNKVFIKVELTKTK